MDKTKKVWCYVYGLLDDDDQVLYCGRSYKPRERARNHYHPGKVKILDKFIDIEYKWVQELKNKGQALKNKELPLYGEDWEVGDIFPTYIEERVRNRHSRKSITQYDLEGNKLKVWDSIIQAQRGLGKTGSSISLCCRGVFKTGYGYIWKYTG